MDRKDPQQRTSEHQCPFTEMSSSRLVTLLKLQHSNLGIRSYLRERALPSGKWTINAYRLVFQASASGTIPSGKFDPRMAE